MNYEIGHIAFVVKDLDAAMAFMTSLGAELTEKKDFLDRPIPQRNIMMDGSTGDWQVTSCKGKLGNMRLQILRPDADGTPYSEFMAKTGGGIHHISFDHLGEDIVAVKDDLVSKGAEVFSYGENKFGPKAFYLKIGPLSDTIIELTK